MKKTVNTNGKKETVKQNGSLEKMSDLDILELDFDKVNIYDLLEKNSALKTKLTTSKGGSKDKMYKVEVDKNVRRKIRNARNMHIENINLAFEQKNKDNVKKFVDAFDKFYKETYTLNDYSIESIARLNSDKITLAKIKIAMHIVKLEKTKK